MQSVITKSYLLFTPSKYWLDVTLVNIMEKVINDEDVEPGEGIIHHEEGIDFIPANIELAGLETSLVNVINPPYPRKNNIPDNGS